MRLIILHNYNIRGGVEKVIVSLAKEIPKLVEKVILVVLGNEYEYFEKILPCSRKLELVPLAWGNEEKTFKVKILDFFYKVVSKVRGKSKISSLKHLLVRVGRSSYHYRLNYLFRKHKATHCLYTLTTVQKPPTVRLPLAAILYDFYWHFSAERYSHDYILLRDAYFKEWAEKADILFAISRATKEEAVKTSPEFSKKIKAVPLACNPPQINISKAEEINPEKEKVPVFFYPASQNSYQKNFITLFKAVHKLAIEGLKFKVIISGRDTEVLTKAKGTNKRQDEEAREYYVKNRDVLKDYVQVLGFCSNEEMDPLFKESKATVLPSVFEGFGLPLIESLVKGLPVISSDIDVFKEQVSIYDCEDLVEFFSSDEPAELAECMEKAIKEPRHRIPQERLKQLFLKRTWEDVAKEYVEALESIKK